MQTRAIPVVSQAIGPAEWPPAPARMTFSKLREIEACPRRWALSSADYPEVWQGSGYPPRLQVPSTVGRIVHLALERIVEALARGGCSSIQDPKTTAVLRQLGGYTQIISECTRDVLSAEKDNPRAQRAEEWVEREIHSRMGEIRERVQVFLAPMRLQAPGSAEDTGEKAARERGELGLGSHPEVLLKAPKLGWLGVADLINISLSDCEIVEFKTGKPSEDHPFQLRVYSLLWAVDADINPSARLATRLTLCYPGTNHNVTPPSARGLKAIERDVRDRTCAAVRAVSTYPPEARPGLDNCGYCHVRHLCDDYWRRSTGHHSQEWPYADKRFIDLELTITERHGPSSWDATAGTSRVVQAGRPVVLQTRPSEFDLRLGDRVRVLDVHLTTAGDDESQPAVVTTVAASEVFFVPAVIEEQPRRPSDHIKEGS